MSPSRSGRRIDPHDWPGDSAYGRSRNRGWAAALVLAFVGLLALGILAEERRQHAEERVQAKDRQLQLLDIQRMHQGDHQQGGRAACGRGSRECRRNPEEKWAIQAQAVAALSGLDVSLEKELRIYAQSLTFAADGTLWLGHTGDGA